MGGPWRTAGVAAALVLLASACSGDASPPPESPPVAGPTSTPEVADAPPEVPAAGSQLSLYLCPDGPDPVYRLPAPVYSATYPASVEGFDQVAKLRGKACDTAEVAARAPVVASEASGGSATQAELRRWGNLFGSAPGLWVRVEVGDPPRLEGWVELWSLPPLNFLREGGSEWALDVPVTLEGPMGPGGVPDLTFPAPTRVVREGDVCTAGEYIPSLYRVAIRNDGGGTGPVGFGLAIEGQGRGEGDIEESDWMRGLEPGEEFELAPLSPGTHLRLDPRDRVRESNEGNNELTLDPLSQLICG